MARRLTAQQIRNRRAMRKWWRSFKKEGEWAMPLIAFIILLGVVAYISININI